MNEKKSSVPNVRRIVPFLWVADMERSLRYYVNGLGYQMTRHWIDSGKIRWCWLELGETWLMLQEFRTEGHDAWRPEGKVGEGVAIVFICQDAIAFYREVTSRGITASEPCVANTMWITSLRDPDGYILNFESKTDLPEDTKLSHAEGGS
jgi:catechol 2,3-dioxygenase-like lactoylglutathione lyase family enzyme